MSKGYTKEFKNFNPFTPDYNELAHPKFKNEVIPEPELEMPSVQADMVNSARKNALNPTHYDEYTNWMSDMSRNYDNFFQMAVPPQRNPFGVAGYPPALKQLELQLPGRPTNMNNPFKNVPIRDYGIPQRYGKSSGENPNPNFYKKMFQSPDDALWHRQASEAQFVTQPVTSVPNEQVKFAEWLWGKSMVCKTGSIYDRYGFPYTPDSLVCNGFNAAEPENGGSLNNGYGVPATYPNASPFSKNLNYGYGFGGIPGGIQMSNIQPTGGSWQLNPYPLVPHFPATPKNSQ